MRPFFILLSIALGFNINPLVMAQSAGKDMQGLIQQFKLSKKEIAQMIELLLKSGKISENEASASLDQLSNMSDEEIKSLSMEAFTNVHSGKPIFADEKASIKGQEKNEKSPEVTSDGPSRIPASNFFGSEENDSEVSDFERKRLKEAQNKIKNTFDIKKYQ